jgi:predicted Zn finger-like uncharacterized protein
MIITCSQCKTSFNLNEKILKPSGSKVRCSKCKNVFVAYPPESVEVPEASSQEESKIAGFDVDTGAQDNSKENRENDAQSDDLDFSDDENFFGTGENDAVGLDAGELDFSLEMDSDDAEETDSGDGRDELGELELPDSDDFFEFEADDLGDLELESDEDKQAIEPVEDSGDLDLSELEKILKLDKTTDTKESGLAEETDEFNLDLESDTGADAVVGADEQAEISAEELDLSDIEKMLEIDKTGTDAEDEHEDEELEFDLEPDQMVGAPISEIEFESDELDLSELEDILEEDQVAEPADVADLDLDLDFSLEEENAETGEGLEKAVSGVPEAKTRPQPDFDIGGEEEFPDLAEMAEKEAELIKTFEMGEPKGNIETAEEEPFPVVEETVERVENLPPVPAKKGVSLPLVILLILSLLAGGVYFVHLYTDIKIPYLSELTAPEVIDAGGLKMTTLGISSRFVENEHAGRFFVITGKIKNGYPEPRSAIKISGKIYSKGKTLEKIKKIFCGNLLTNTELGELDVDAINKRLNNPLGDSRSNVNVAPGKILPFMVVFTELPENLEEYTIEAIGSQVE